MPPGLYITYVEPGSDAYEKGVEDGDILLSVDDQKLTTMDELQNILYQYQVGQSVEAVIYRAGQRYLVELTLTEDRG